MNKSRLLFLMLCVSFIVGFFALIFIINHPRYGKTQFYTKIIDVVPLDDGSTHWQYHYSLIAYSIDGAAVEIQFTAPKILREGAYLRIYSRHPDGGDVTSWQEISYDEIPRSARRQLE